MLALSFYSFPHFHNFFVLFIKYQTILFIFNSNTRRMVGQLRKHLTINVLENKIYSIIVKKIEILEDNPQEKTYARQNLRGCRARHRIPNHYH